MDYAKGLKISLVIAFFISVFLSFWFSVKFADIASGIRKNNKYWVLLFIIIFSLVFIAFVPAVYSISNFLALLFDESYNFEIDNEFKTLLVRVFCIYVFYKLMKLLVWDILYEKNLSDILRIGNDKIKRYLSIYLGQSIFYIISLSIIWVTFIINPSSMLGTAVISVVIFIIGDWYMIAEYMTIAKGKVLKWHIYKIVFLNFTIVILDICLIVINTLTTLGSPIENMGASRESNLLIYTSDLWIILLLSVPSIFLVGIFSYLYIQLIYKIEKV